MKLKLSEIIIHDGRRGIDYDKVLELAESIRIVGLINPITVRKDKTLVAGAHRFEACRHLGHDKIECIVLNCDKLHAELAEIDENLIRNDLDPIAIGELAIRRDEILDALGLRAKSGENQHTQRGGESDSPPPNTDEAASAPGAPVQTTTDIAKNFGIGERALQQNKQLAKNLVPEAKETVRELGLSKKDALNLARLEPDQQREVIAKGDRAEIQQEIHQRTQDKEWQESENYREGYGKPGDDGKIRPLKYQPRKKTVAKTEEPEEEHEGDFLKLPLPLELETMFMAFARKFKDESEEIREQVIGHVKFLAEIIDNLND